MMFFLEVLHQVIQINGFWASLGFITAISMFVSPVLYKGDHKSAKKSILVLTGYALFVTLIEYFQISDQGFLPTIPRYYWIQPALVLSFVALAYSLGLVIGVWLHGVARRERSLHL